MTAKVHIGTMGWSYDFWTGNFYPEDTKPDSFLSEYAKHFHTVEVDNTFYRIPNKDTVIKWREQTPPDFLFSAKFPRRITHEKMLRDCEDSAKFFLERISLLEDKLGPLLLQFPYAFKLEHIEKDAKKFFNKVSIGKLPGICCESSGRDAELFIATMKP